MEWKGWLCLLVELFQWDTRLETGRRGVGWACGLRWRGLEGIFLEKLGKKFVLGKLIYLSDGLMFGGKQAGS